jgi:hypothetical protein
MRRRLCGPELCTVRRCLRRPGAGLLRAHPPCLPCLSGAPDCAEELCLKARFSAFHQMPVWRCCRGRITLRRVRSASFRALRKQGLSRTIRLFLSTGPVSAGALPPALHARHWAGRPLYFYVMGRQRGTCCFLIPTALAALPSRTHCELPLGFHPACCWTR